MKTFELSLGIILMVAFFVLRFSRVFRWEWTFRRDPSRTVETVLGLGMLAGGGFMLWLWSR
jgi:dipeptide/tripeptide permease